MRYFVKIYFFPLFIFGILLPFSCSPAKNRSETVWYDFNKGYAKALMEKKPMIVDFYADWCSWCKKMDVDVFQNGTVSAILARDFISIRINTEGSEKITFKGQTYSAQDFASLVGVSGLPTLLFIDKNGELITKLPGYVPVETLQPILGYMKSECYKGKIAFDDYKNGKVQCN
jgi:thioredoxin-related protein